jgi:methylenetetrahydrofolate dehydrogenase (NADP+) / methenyltetrahydrofolate cyclohydrolase
MEKMPAKVLDGKACAAKVLDRVKEKASALAPRGVIPGLATVLVGEDPASKVYVGAKIKACGANGLKSVHVPLPAAVSQKDLLAKIEELNRSPDIHGILVQMPLPSHLNAEEAVLAIDPAKDADGLHPANQGRWAQMKSWKDVKGSGLPLPCTPAGCMEILEQHGISPAGANAVVLGRSLLVGKPLSLMLLAADATVTMAHSRTKDLADLCRRADILVAAIGRPRFVQGDWVRPGAVVIDVGINRLPEGLAGDVDFPAASQRAAGITPVPGGVGPMTVAMLLWNTVQSAAKIS